MEEIRLTTGEELERLNNCASSNEWDSICDDIKAARGGEFPPDWFVRIHLSGLMRRVANNWK